jgi:O-antigen ligase
MKSGIFNISGKQLLSDGYLSFLCALVIAILLPVYHWFLPPVIILWVLVRIAEIGYNGFPDNGIEKTRRALFFLFIFFFSWQLAGILYSENIPAAFRNIEVRLSFFLFPLLLIYPGKTIKAKAYFILKAFAISNFLFVVFCYAFAFWRSISFVNGITDFNPHPANEPWLNYFYAMKLAIFQHPSYLALYTLFSAFIALNSFFDNSKSIKKRILWLLICLILLVTVFYLSSRAGILAAILGMLLYFFRQSRRGTASRTVLIGIIAFILISIPLLISNPRVGNYIRSLSDWHAESNASQNGRIVIWKSVANIIKENTILGVGTGDIQDQMNQEYDKIGRSDLARGNFNSHNQFIEILIENGVVGLLIFVMIFVAMLYIAVREWNLLLVMFILIVFVSFMFETMLNRLAGVTFFPFFAFLLLHLDSRNKNALQAE